MRSQIPWTKRQLLKIWSIFSLLWLQRQHMFEISILLAIRNSQVRRAFLITSHKKKFNFAIRFKFQIQCGILDLGCIKGFLIAQVANLRVNLPSCENSQKILSHKGEEGIGIALISARTFRGRIEEIDYRFYSLKSWFIKSYTLAYQLM